jgi:hypothetical protein
MLAFDADERAVAGFAEAAKALHVPLKIVRDTYGDGRTAYEAKMILVRPDRYVAWTGDETVRDLKATLGKAVARVSSDG